MRGAGGLYNPFEKLAGRRPSCSSNFAALMACPPTLTLAAGWESNRYGLLAYYVSCLVYIPETMQDFLTSEVREAERLSRRPMPNIKVHSCWFTSSPPAAL